MSPKDKVIGVRLSEDEYIKIEAATKAAGFISIAEFVRYMTVGEGRSIQNDLKEILRKLEGINKNKKRK